MTPSNQDDKIAISGVLSKNNHIRMIEFVAKKIQAGDKTVKSVHSALDPVVEAGLNALEVKQ